MTRQKMYIIVAKELGYESYDAEWGRQHLVGGNHGDCFFSDSTEQMWEKLISARLKLFILEEKGRVAA